MKKIAFFFQPYSNDKASLFLDILKQFEQNGFEIFCDQNSAQFEFQNKLDYETLFNTCDCFISIGGDGTFISLARHGFKYQKPIAGIYAGNLGFLTEWRQNEVSYLLEELKSDTRNIRQRSILQMQLGNKTYFAINDLVFNRRSTQGKMIKQEVFINDQYANTYKGDGLILSTPSGSSAYNLAAFGPLVYPSIDVLVLNPICSHQLTQRPIVLSGNACIKIVCKEEQIVSFDGQEIICIAPLTEITISSSAQKCLILRNTRRDYFTKLRELLKWGH